MKLDKYSKYIDIYKSSDWVVSHITISTVVRFVGCLVIALGWCLINSIVVSNVDLTLDIQSTLRDLYILTLVNFVLIGVALTGWKR